MIKVGDKVICIENFDNFLYGEIYSIRAFDLQQQDRSIDKKGFQNIENIKHIYIEFDKSEVWKYCHWFTAPDIISYTTSQFYDHFIFLRESRKLKLKKLYEQNII